MSKTVIEAEALGKSYIIGHKQKEPYSTLRDVLTKLPMKWLSRLRGSRNHFSERTEEFWALKDLYFKVNEGDRVGIVGRNGAGKSTLLKIISRITEPTNGKVKIKGRVASLLEVGTGFHPELTGRENIYLNGAILGMRHFEVKNRFDEIVAFSEVEKFLDTPVKRYSSGMYVRLAFAVAAHLEPEILIVDEVLAVGDAQFQKKCLGKMESVGKDGRTVIFVSHNLHAVKQLCTKGLLLDSGYLVYNGSSQQAVDEYLQKTIKNSTCFDIDKAINSLPIDPSFKLEAINMSQNGITAIDSIENGSPLEVNIHYCIHHLVLGLRIFIDMLDDHGAILFRSFHDGSKYGISSMEPGSYISKVVIPPNLLATGSYTLCIKAGIFGVRYTIPEEGICIPLHVEQTSPYNWAYSGDRLVGKLALSLNWEIRKGAKIVE